MHWALEVFWEDVRPCCCPKSSFWQKLLVNMTDERNEAKLLCPDACVAFSIGASQVNCEGWKHQGMLLACPEPSM